MSAPWPPGARPVIVGGVGGSGTRVIALILQASGYYLGRDLNTPQDNLWFTLLFKRPRWFVRAQKDNRMLAQGFRVLETVMRGQSPETLSDKFFVVKAACEHALTFRNPPAANGIWPLRRAWNMLVSPPKPPASCTSWGWKEPNTHFYFDYLAGHSPTARFIHTVRHGLDMAFSGNQQQLEHWGWLFDVKPPASAAEAPGASLEFWVKANRRAREIGRRLGPKRFLFLNFDHLCADPQSGVRQVLDFLEIDVPVNRLDELIKIPTVPKSAGRYRQHDLSQFTPEMLDSVRDLGFEVEIPFLAS